MTAGQSRPSAACALVTAAVVARTWASSVTLVEVTQTPARWCFRTMAAGTAGSVPAYRPTITCPASSSVDIPATSSSACATSPTVGPQEVGSSGSWVGSGDAGTEPPERSEGRPSAESPGEDAEQPASTRQSAGTSSWTERQSTRSR